MTWLVGILILLCVCELLVYITVRSCREQYQWLITAADELPEIDDEVLDKFIKHGFDSQLGWVRKPNTNGIEQGRHSSVRYSINSIGARSNPGHEHLPHGISCYGDSFVFCRQVNDDETWEYYLSDLAGCNVSNFGVGNYGLDQALLRLQREYARSPAPVVMLGVVPETISRVLNVWKHYNEYGNVFGFKPRYQLRDGHLELIENMIIGRSDFQNLQKHLPRLQAHDYFYLNKFKKDLLSFPYSWSLARTYRRNVPLIARILLKRMYDLLRIRADYHEYLHNVSVLQRNIALCARLYYQQNVVHLMVTLLEEFNRFGREHGFTPIFLLLPQLNDIVYIRQHGSYYAHFVAQARKLMLTVDLTESIMECENISALYSNDNYGGHFSPAGNQFVAKTVYEYLCSAGVIDDKTAHNDSGVKLEAEGDFNDEA